MKNCKNYNEIIKKIATNKPVNPPEQEFMDNIKNLSMDMFPILYYVIWGLIAVGVIGLIVLILIVYTQFQKVKAIFITLWNFVKRIWGIIKRCWKTNKENLVQKNESDKVNALEAHPQKESHANCYIEVQQHTIGEGLNGFHSHYQIPDVHYQAPYYSVVKRRRAHSVTSKSHSKIPPALPSRPRSLVKRKRHNKVIYTPTAPIYSPSYDGSGEEQYSRAPGSGDLEIYSDMESSD